MNARGLNAAQECDTSSEFNESFTYLCRPGVVHLISMVVVPKLLLVFVFVFSF